MENVYFLMLVTLALLAIVDIVVGVSNDAINFLNSAIGSKVLSFRTIMIVSSIGIFIGAVYSSGMMEVARKGIFNPGEFYFDEIMMIFLAVIMTDILLLDFFNTLGLPTSTTVSIVFNLLGAAIVMSLIKIAENNESVLDLANYINTEKATMIIAGILLSVLIAFSIGVIVQWISRLIFSFQYQKKLKNFGFVFGGIALTAITYFIFIKGLKGSPYYKDLISYIGDNDIIILIISIILFSLFSYVFEFLTKKSVLIVVIAAGTFGLALAFAGNDLVNFIGVSMAAYHSYEAWVVSGIEASLFSMEVLDKKVPAEPFLLFLAGGIMVLTLWFSKKASTVLETTISLSRQRETHEKFNPTFLSRTLVSSSSWISSKVFNVLPNNFQNKIELSFKQAQGKILTKDQSIDAPAFDMIRASVNLMVAGILISIATSMKLPLSTTYVTFMVAMGTSLSDKAWGRESAVYRVAGVLNVIGGWFLTAFGALVASGMVVFLINWNKEIMIPVLLIITVIILVRNFLYHKRIRNSRIDPDSLKKSESKTVQGIISESSDNIIKVLKRSDKIFSTVINGLTKEDSEGLKRAKKGVKKLNSEIEDLRDNIFYFIKNLDETSVRGSNFYIIILADLTDIAESLDYISKKSFKHVNNQHKKLRFNQLKDLNEIRESFNALSNQIMQVFKDQRFETISLVISQLVQLRNNINDRIDMQIGLTRKEALSPKNTSLYFNLLLETKDLLKSVLNLIDEYSKSYKKD